MVRSDCTRSAWLITLFLALISLGLIAAPPALAGTVSPLPYTIENAPLIIEAYAVRYGISAAPLVGTLRCESGFKGDAIGDYGTSYGVSQIHLPAHKDISKEEALNPFFAIDWAAYQFSQGNQNMWSCYKLLYPKKGGSSG